MKKSIKHIISLTAVVFFLFLALSSKNKSDNKPNNTYNETDDIQEIEMTHRCGRTWDGKLDSTYGIYGDYCSERCYADLYPN